MASSSAKSKAKSVSSADSEKIEITVEGKVIEVPAAAAAQIRKLAHKERDEMGFAHAQGLENKHQAGVDIQ